jgi:hypothetical protein
VLTSYEQRTGKKLDITRKPRSELKDRLAANPDDLIAYLLLEWDEGRGLVGEPSQLDVGEWPEWAPRKAVDVLIG